MGNIDHLVQDFLAQKTIAVVGVSDKRETGCNLNYKKFKENGYNVYAVNPRITVYDGAPCYPDLTSIPEKPDAVFILASPGVTDQIVQQCVELGIKHVWMHCMMGTRPGLVKKITSVSPTAVEMCNSNGIAVIPGTCPAQFLKPDLGHAIMRRLWRMLGFLKLCLVFLILSAHPASSQVKIDSTEITSSVPALTDFHEIIFDIWHNAYPAKDIKALKDYVPQIKASMEDINNASLPGILKDKEADWKNQLKAFNSSAENYYRAAEGNDDAAMLDAAEKLHYNFEMMIRVIRPALKEVDDYHQTLYIIYHKLYPARQYNEIAGLMDNLIEKADAIVKYPPEKLKKRLGDNVSKFDQASRELYSATVSLQEALKGNDARKKDEAVEHMHTMYQHLEAVFK